MVIVVVVNVVILWISPKRMQVNHLLPLFILCLLVLVVSIIVVVFEVEVGLVVEVVLVVLVVFNILRAQRFRSSKFLACWW